MMLAGFVAVLAGIGVVQAVIGAVLAGRFAHSSPSPAERERSGEGAAGRTHYPHPTLSRGAGEGDLLRPPITILKPLHGDEPLLEQALASVCAQDYPEYQVVFGVSDAADPALSVVTRLRARFPECDIAVVVDPARHGTNGKVGNLINMLPRAKHAVLAIANSDLHVQPDYLARLADALAEPVPAWSPPSTPGCRQEGAWRSVSAPRRSPTIFCPERCWRERWGGRTAWAPR